VTAKCGENIRKEGGREGDKSTKGTMITIIIIIIAKPQREKRTRQRGSGEFLERNVWGKKFHIIKKGAG